MRHLQRPLRAGHLVLVLGLVLLLVVVWWISRPLQVTGYLLESRTLQQRVIASGTVTSDVISQIGSEITGTISARHVREGDQVQAGQLLLELNAEREQAVLTQAQSALTEAQENQRPQAQARLHEARVNRQQAQAELQRRETLYAKGLFAEEALFQARQKLSSADSAQQSAELAFKALQDTGSRMAQLRAQQQEASAQLAKTQIRAARDGTILTRSVEVGDHVQAGRTLLTMAHANSLEILVPIDEKLIAPLTVGQRAYVIADAYPTQAIPAQVSFLAPNVDPSRGSLDVRLALDETTTLLRQGMTVTADIHTQRQTDALVIAHDALFERAADQATVLTLVEGRVLPQRITLGIRGQTLSSVQQGLAPGAVVLNQWVPEGQKVKVTLLPEPAEASLP